MSIRKSRFLQEEHGQMGQETTMLRWVDELQHQLESAHHESQGRAAEVTGAQAAELLTAERATAAEQGLDAAKVHLVETMATLQKFLEALETKQKARSEADREVLTL